MVKPAQASKHGQTHPSPVKAWSKPSHLQYTVKPTPPTRTPSKQAQPTPSPFKTRLNPPQSIQSMVKPSQTHPKPTLNPPQTHPLFLVSSNMVKPTPNPRAPCRWRRRLSSKSSSSLGAWQLKIRACNTLEYLFCSKSKPAKNFFHSAVQSAQP